MKYLVNLSTPQFASVIGIVALMMMTGCRITSSTINQGDVFANDGRSKSINLRFGAGTVMNTVTTDTVNVTGPHGGSYVSRIYISRRSAKVITDGMENLGNYTLEVKGVKYRLGSKEGYIEPFKAVFTVTDTPFVKSPYTGKFWTANLIKDELGDSIRDWTLAFNACPFGFRLPTEQELIDEMATIPVSAQKDHNPDDIEKITGHFLYSDNSELLSSSPDETLSSLLEQPSAYTVLRFSRKAVSGFYSDYPIVLLWRYKYHFSYAPTHLAVRSDIRCIQH